MKTLASVLWLSASVVGAYPVSSERGSQVSLQVSVAGRPGPLYASADGRRYYVEARAGSRYELYLTNRTADRVGVELTVDGLNVISGERDRPGPDRMYILGPYESTTVRGWRTSLEEVRRFTFVDEKVSYASRVGKANAKMGWIEMAVYRERRVHARPLEEHDRCLPRGRADEPEAKAEAQRPEAREKSRDSAGAAPAAPAQSYPGTGWGSAVEDQVRLVDFEAEPVPVETMTVRYEYRSALQALGILPSRDRLAEREGGFVPPPRW